MKLPNYDQAYVPREKIVNYLLSESHPRGSTKAVFFRRFGFDEQNWELLAHALKEHAAAHDAFVVETTVHGVCYNVIGELITPNGRSPIVLSSWFFDTGSGIPRFVTAFPN